MSTDQPAADSRALRKLLRPMVLTGGLIIFCFFGVLGGWASYAPLASAAVATGVVSPNGSRRSIQHLEGGIIKELLVREGSEVLQGQPLVVLQDTQAKAQYQANLSSMLQLMAIRSRLVALQLDLETLDFDPKVVSEMENNAEFAKFIRAQEDLFVTKRKGHEGRKSILATQRQQLFEQLKGVEAEFEGNKLQLELIDTEVEGLLSVPAGTVRTSRIREMQRMQAEVASKTAGSRAQIASVKQKISEVDLAILNADNEYRDVLADEMMRINAELSQVSERVAAGHDVLTRTIVSAPVDGIVVGLKFKTIGGVVRPGDVIMQLVPTKEDLIIDARLRPIDRDVVVIGQVAQVNLIPYVQRNLPILEGNVVSISADTLNDERTGESYYEAKISIDRDKLDVIAPEVELSAGMPTDVLILTGSRPAALYVLEPILRSLNRAAREQ